MPAVKKVKKISRSLKALLALLIFVSLIFSVGVVSAEDDGNGFIEVDGLPCKDDEIIVKFEKSETLSEIASSVESVGSEIKKTLQDDIAVLDVPAGETVESFIAEIQDTPGVEYAQPNFVYELDATSVNDPYVTGGNQWYLDKIGVFDAWDNAMGSGIIVAVLDTGIDLAHVEFDGQIYMQTDVVDNDGSAQDDNGHGTHVCGIVAAKANNGIGGAGVAPQVQLIVVDVFYKYNEGGVDKWSSSTSDGIEGITYAVNNGARVINMSFGGYGDDQLFGEAIDAASAAGVVCVAAAGNDSTSVLYYPSDYESCIAVIATDSNDLRVSYSNYGAQKDIAAPGSIIVSTYPGGYATMSGTSMAAPVVSGVVALMLSINSDLTVSEVKNILYSTALDLGTAGKDDQFANGRVDAAAAIAQTVAFSGVSGVALDKTELGMSVGDIEPLIAVVSPSSAVDKTVSWSSDNEAVATVVEGVVSAVGLGTANIIVETTDGGFTDTCFVTVYKKVTGVSLDSSEMNINAGDSQTLQATVLPEDADNKAVSWSSGNTSVAIVENGVVTGVAAGEATVRATTQDGGFYDECAVFVTATNIESNVYTVNQAQGYLLGVKEGTSVAQLEGMLNNDVDNIHVYYEGTEYTGDSLRTGMEVKLIVNGITTDMLTIVVTGECNGDGYITITDYTLIRLDILQLKALSGAFIAAADINNDGNITITDYTLIRLHILKLKIIE